MNSDGEEYDAYEVEILFLHIQLKKFLDEEFRCLFNNDINEIISEYACFDSEVCYGCNETIFEEITNEGDFEIYHTYECWEPVAFCNTCREYETCGNFF